MPPQILASLFRNKVPLNLDIFFTNTEKLRSIVLVNSKPDEKGYIFGVRDGDDLEGIVAISCKPDEPLEHSGVKLELIGRIETTLRGTSAIDFLSISKDLEPPGFLTNGKTLLWKFKSLDMPHETYKGINIKLRYFLRVTINRPYHQAVTKELDFVVQNPRYMPKQLNPPVKLEVGIEDCVRIEVTLAGGPFPLNGCILGAVHFNAVRLKIRHMEIDILRQESVGGATPAFKRGSDSASNITDANLTGAHLTGSNLTVENCIVTKFEIMDGTPARDEIVPIRMFLRGLHLTPTYENIQNQFSVRYILSLVIYDEDDRRYFKKQEIFLLRDKETKHFAEQAFATI